ncbi:MAG TPA: hypothetical protein VI874_04945, partial [Candidatus Norongarragalinales archaeon]|nr:hypothetical protein [Candidatus Norongarragalinales archaeon]
MMRKAILLFFILLLGAVQAGTVFPGRIQLSPQKAVDLVNSFMELDKEFTIETEGGGQLSGFSALDKNFGSLVVLFIRPPFRVTTASAKTEFLETYSSAGIDAVRPLTLTFVGVRSKGGLVDFTLVDPDNPQGGGNGPIECKGEQFYNGVRFFSACTFHVSQLEGFSPYASLNPSQAPVAFVGDTLQYYVFDGGNLKVKKVTVVKKADRFYRVENAVPLKQSIPTSNKISKPSANTDLKKTFSGITPFEGVRLFSQELSRIGPEPSGYSVEIANAFLIGSAKAASQSYESLLLLSAPFTVRIKGRQSSHVFTVNSFLSQNSKPLSKTIQVRTNAPVSCTKENGIPVCRIKTKDPSKDVIFLNPIIA